MACHHSPDPSRPNYLRVKIGRRLQALGAVAVKNSVYVLPQSDQSLEDFQWVRREIVAGRGEATICESRFVEGHTDGDVEALFRTAREADYSSLARETRIWSAPSRAGGGGGRSSRRGRCSVGCARGFPRFTRSTSSEPPGERAWRAGWPESKRGSGRPPQQGRPSGGPPRPRPARPHLGDEKRHPRRPHGERVAHPALRRSSSPVQVRAGARVTRRAAASCASTCPRRNSRTTATAARSRCWCGTSAVGRAGTAPPRRDRPRHRPQGRQVRAAGGAWARAADRRHRDAPCGRRGPAEGGLGHFRFAL